MKPESKILFDFQRKAYELGFLDEANILFGSLIDPDIELLEVLSDFEDRTKDTDIDALDEKFDSEILPVIESLTDDNIILALKELVTIFGPIIRKAQEDEGTLKAAIERYKNLGKNLGLLLPALAPALLKKNSPVIEQFIKEKAGQMMGSGLTNLFTIINTAYEKDPEIISGFTDSMVNALDTGEMKKSAGIVLDAIIERKPKAAGLIGRFMLKRIRKRLTK